MNLEEEILKKLDNLLVLLGRIELRLLVIEQVIKHPSQLSLTK